MRLLIMLCIAACGSDVRLTRADVTTTTTRGLSGAFSLLTYNVAGLPEPLSASKPEEYSALIGPLLNAFDLVLLQEDFWYHWDLVSAAEHAYQSAPYRDEPKLLDIGDGLNQLSRFPFESYAREPWGACNGTIRCDCDCLADKGFTFSVLTLAEGAQVHVYNLHMDAGRCGGDMPTRAEQVRQLTRAIVQRSAGAALIVAGDTNLYVTEPEDADTLQKLLADTGLRDACPSHVGIDRVFIRSTDALSLSPLSCRIVGDFLAPNGERLSDHPPLETQISWRR